MRGIKKNLMGRGWRADGKDGMYKQEECGSSAQAGKRYSIAPSCEEVISYYLNHPTPRRTFYGKGQMQRPRPSRGGGSLT